MRRVRERRSRWSSGDARGARDGRRTIERRGARAALGGARALKQAWGARAGVQVDEQRSPSRSRWMADRVESPRSSCGYGLTWRRAGGAPQPMGRWGSSSAPRAGAVARSEYHRVQGQRFRHHATVIAMKGELEKSESSSTTWSDPAVVVLAAPSGAARRPSRASCGRGCPTLRVLGVRDERARRGRRARREAYISSRATSSSGGVRRVSSWSRPSMRGSCTHAPRRVGECCATGSTCARRQVTGADRSGGIPAPASRVLLRDPPSPRVADRAAGKRRHRVGSRAVRSGSTSRRARSRRRARESGTCTITCS